MSNYPRKTILCIDDDDGVLSYHRALLERRGFEVLTAGSARQGLQMREPALLLPSSWITTCPR
jgi:DNA-binding NtrC family response regulator